MRLPVVLTAVTILFASPIAHAGCEIADPYAIVCAAGGYGQGQISTANLLERFGLHYKNAATTYFSDYLRQYQCGVAGRLRTRQVRQMGPAYRVPTAHGYVTEVTVITEDEIGAAFYVPKAAMRGTCDSYRAPVITPKMPPIPLLH
jgi:hypothetical protein